MNPSKTTRCAIYTRKSSEEGLEQDFNSLEAQREACEAYIRSQAHEGWKLLPGQFDDGGFSGGNMERPALKGLMDLVRAGRVDTIVVYKIDRLTRSLTDFAKLADLLDKHKVSFVSVTQQFNTTTSMGRLMLNVLLSFAQFEREITGERIRDKIGASKKKGMWMGGVPPMGYDVVDRKLVVNERDAEAVRRIFDLYLDERTVPALLDRLEREDIRTARRYSAKGNHYGNRPFTRGHIYKLLSNPIYVGRVPHKATSYRGQHEPIVAQAIWDAVQAQLASNTQGSRERTRKKATTWLLEGLLWSEAGHPLTPSHATKGKRRYRYYVERLPGPDRGQPIRLPAREIEIAVRDGILAFLSDHRSLVAELSNTQGAREGQIVAGAIRLSNDLSKPAHRALRDHMTNLVRKVVYQHNRILIEFNRAALTAALLGIDVSQVEDSNDGRRLEMTMPLTQRRRGRQMKIRIDGTSQPSLDRPLITAVVRAWDWADQLVSGKVSTMAEICEAEGFSDTYVGQLLPLAFIAPGDVEHILNGYQSPDLSADRLIWAHDVPLAWTRVVA